MEHTRKLKRRIYDRIRSDKRRSLSASESNGLREYRRKRRMQRRLERAAIAKRRTS